MRLEYYKEKVRKGEYKEMEEEKYIKKYCNNSWLMYNQRTLFVGFEMLAFSDVIYRVDLKNKILVYDKTMIGD